MQGIHRSPVNSPQKGQWRGALMFSLICVLNKRLSKQWWGWWLETPTHLLWRHFSVKIHYTDVIMDTIASQITNLTIVYSTVHSDADQRKYQSSASLAFVRGIHRRPVNSPHKWPVTRKMFPFDDVITLMFSFMNMFSNMLSSYSRDCSVNSLWPGDATGQHKSGSTLAQVMVCCLTTLSHCH